MTHCRICGDMCLDTSGPEVYCENCDPDGNPLVETLKPGDRITLVSTCKLNPSDVYADGEDFDDENEEFEFDCGMDSAGNCGYAGSEECDFECPYNEHYVSDSRSATSPDVAAPSGVFAHEE